MSLSTYGEVQAEALEPFLGATPFFRLQLSRLNFANQKALLRNTEFERPGLKFHDDICVSSMLVYFRQRNYIQDLLLRNLTTSSGAMFSNPLRPAVGCQDRSSIKPL